MQTAIVIVQDGVAEFYDGDDEVDVIILDFDSFASVATEAQKQQLDSLIDESSYEAAQALMARAEFATD